MASKKRTIGIGLQTVVFLLVIAIALIVVNTLIYRTFTKEFAAQNKMYSIYQPSINELYKLNDLNIKSVSLIKNWVFIDKDSGTIQKRQFKELYKNTYPNLKQSISNYFNNWGQDEQNVYYSMLDAMDSLISEEILITDELVFFDDYNNTELMFDAYTKLTDKGVIIEKSTRVEAEINLLTQKLEDKIEQFNDQSKLRFIKLRSFISWLTIILVLVVALLAVYLYSNFNYVTNTLNNALSKISKGNLPNVKRSRRVDEIGDLNDNLVNLIEYLKKSSTYAFRLSQNELNEKFEKSSENDTLGKSLLQLREYLINAKKDEQVRLSENTDRQWASQGIAEFNEVIRDHSNNLEDLTQSVVEKIVHYTDSNIGGLYIVNDENELDKFLELKAFYAYDRFKYINRKLHFGETLVGQCYIEKDVIYVNDVPEDYLYISSGLGKDKPKSILIVPLIFNEFVYGVLELASFKDFPTYKIDFVKRISETIASSISTVRINEQTQKLLAESNEKSKRLELQEIETKDKIQNINKQIEDLKRQNTDLNSEKENLMKQLYDLQGQMDNTINENNSEIDKINQRANELLFVLNNSIPYFEMSINDDITFANEIYLKLHDLSAKDVLNTKHSKLLSRDFVNSGGYKQVWDKLKFKEQIETSVQYLIEGKVKFFTETFIPIIDKEGNISKIAVLGRM